METLGTTTNGNYLLEASPTETRLLAEIGKLASRRQQGLRYGATWEGFGAERPHIYGDLTPALAAIKLWLEANGNLDDMRHWLEQAYRLIMGQMYPEENIDA